MFKQTKEIHDLKKTFARYVSLNVIGMLGLSCYILADTVFIANGVGGNGLTALNLVLPIFSLLNALGLMLGMGGATRYTILRSNQKETEANKSFTQTILITGMLGIFITVIGLFFAYDIAKLLGADKTIAPMSGNYLKTILLFSSAFLFNNVFICFVRNDGNPRLSMTAMLVGSFGNILLDYVFIYPLKLGMFGAAFATGLSPLISLSVLSLHFLKKKNNLKLVRTPFMFHSIFHTLTLGLPSFITELSSGIIILCFNYQILNLSGNTGVAAYGIIANIVLTVVAMFTGISQGIQPLLSSNYGAGKIDYVKSIYRWAIYLAFAFGVFFYTICYLYPEPIVAIFNTENDALLSELAIQGMKIYFAAFFFMGTNIVTTSFFTSIDQPKQSFVISITRGIVAVLPLIFLLPIFFKMTGVWLTIPLVEAITLCISTKSIIKYWKTHPTIGN